MEHQLTAKELLCLAGGAAYLQGLYSALEGLAGSVRVRGNIVCGRVVWLDTYRTCLQLTPPYASRCSCPERGACRHVVTLGLTFLRQERQRNGNTAFPADESTFHSVVFLEEQTLRGLVLELLGTYPGTSEAITAFLSRADREEASN